MSIFGLFGCIPPIRGIPDINHFVPIGRGVINLLAHGFLIKIAKSEVYEQ